MPLSFVISASMEREAFVKPEYVLSVTNLDQITHSNTLFCSEKWLVAIQYNRDTHGKSGLYMYMKTVCRKASKPRYTAKVIWCVRWCHDLKKGK